jgi:c-di-GMP-binding flagellar brake protein YcgR
MEPMPSNTRIAPLQRRQYERIPFSANLEVKNLDAGWTCRGRSIDLSRNGIGFFGEQFMPAGTRIRISIWIEGNGLRVLTHVSATVTRAQTEGGGGGIMGAQFDLILAPQSQPALCAMVDSRS